MSAAIARRRKQLVARKATGEDDAVATRLQTLLGSDELDQEATAYEALQLAQSQVRKRVKSSDYNGACALAYQASLSILKKGRVSVASQLLQLLANTLRETHTPVTTEWMDQITELHQAHEIAMAAAQENNDGGGKLTMTGPEQTRLERLEKEFLRRTVQWSSELGTVRFGDTRLQELLGHQCWKLSTMVEADETNSTQDEDEDDDEEESTSSSLALQSDAVSHMALAEQPLVIVKWLKTLPAPTKEELAMNHTCPPAKRDTLLTRSLLLLCAVENLRDAHILLHGYIQQVEERDMDELTKSYMAKDDGKTPSHVVFGSMLLKVCQKDTRTGPLFSWMLRSFKKELEGGFHQPQVIQSYTTKIGKVYFNIQPPPSMMSTIENMMGMMGGGGGGGGGMNPAMMQQMMGAMQGGM